MKRCFIFGAGEYDKSLPDINENDLVIAADGGYAHAVSLGFAPSLTIGDMDSSEKEPGGKVLRLPVEKDVTDLDAAVGKALEKKAEEIHIYGGMGGRPDHSFANYSLLARLAEKGIKAFLYGENYKVQALYNDKIKIKGKKGSTVSVFSWTEKAEGVSLKGLKYPLSGYTLTNLFALGVSNSFLEEEAEISVKKGILIIMQENAF